MIYLLQWYQIRKPEMNFFSDADFALNNRLVMDISSYWNSDPETKEVASTVNDCGLGCYGTEKEICSTC